MKRSRHSSSLVYGLYINAALLLGILVALLSRGRSDVTGAAFALPTEQPPIAGGGGVYVMPCQMHPAVWGCYVLDTNRQTLCAYEYRAGDKALILTAARNYRYDLDLKNFNTFPAWYDIQKAVEDAAKNEQMNESKLPSVTPAVPKEDNP